MLDAFWHVLHSTFVLFPSDMPTTTTSMPTMLVVLMTLLSPAALVLASDSLSVGRGFTAQNSLSLPRDSSGRPDYCVITKAHTACNLKKVGNRHVGIGLEEKMKKKPTSFSSLSSSGFRCPVRRHGALERREHGGEGRDRPSAQRVAGASCQRPREERTTRAAAAGGRHGTNGKCTTSGASASTPCSSTPVVVTLVYTESRVNIPDDRLAFVLYSAASGASALDDAQ